MEKKNILRFIGIIVLAAVIGFSFAACGGDDDGDGGSKSVGNNAVGGKTWYEYSDKTEFAANGTYTGYSAKRDSNRDYVLDANGKYQWVISETGTYTWNEDAKTVTLRLGKASAGDDGKLLDRAGLKSAYTAYMDEEYEAYKDQAGWTKKEDMIAGTGYSSIAQYIDAYVNEMFSDRPHAYSFSKDGKSLLIQEALPQPKGTDELAGQTYSGRNNTQYVFGSNSTYTIKSTYSGTTATEQETGSYSYDSTRKQVYFSRVKYYGQTALEYYETVTVPSGGTQYGDSNRFSSDDAYKASRTNDQFYRSSRSYDPDAKTIGE